MVTDTRGHGHRSTTKLQKTIYSEASMRQPGAKEIAGSSNNKQKSLYD